MSDLQLLTDVATPDLYRSNPFRLLGLPVTANARTIRRTAERLQKRLKFGHEASLAHAPLALTPTEDAISEATRRLDDPADRLITELFWLWPPDENREADDPAATALAAGDVASALAIWSEGANGNRNGVSRLHNVAVLSHTLALDFEHEESTGRALAEGEHDALAVWALALQSWQRLLAEEAFWSRLRDRVREIDDPQLTTGTIHRLREALPLTLLQINGALALDAARRGDDRACGRHADLLKDAPFEPDVVDLALRNASQSRRQRLAAEIEHAKAEAVREGPESGAGHARALLASARAHLDVLDLILPEDSPLRGEVHDRVAAAVLEMAIDFGNETKRWREAEVLLGEIEPLAVGAPLRQRIHDNQDIVNSNAAEGLCWFCETEDADDKVSKNVTVYGEFVYDSEEKSFSWSYQDITVGRCKACAEKHGSNTNVALIFLIMASIFIFLFYVSDHATLRVVLLLCSPLFFIPIARVRRKKERVLAGTKPLDKWSDYPEYKKHLDRGWTTHNPKKWDDTFVSEMRERINANGKDFQSRLALGYHLFQTGAKAGALDKVDESLGLLVQALKIDKHNHSAISLAIEILNLLPVYSDMRLRRASELKAMGLIK